MLDSEHSDHAQTLFSVLTLLDSDSEKKTIFNNISNPILIYLEGPCLQVAGNSCEDSAASNAPCFQPRGWAWLMLTSF